MKLWQSIILTIIIVILLMLLPKELSNPVSYAVVILSAFWAYNDSKKLEAYKYKSNVGMSSGTLAFWMFILWPFIFPPYLGLRYRIKNNKVELKDKFKNN